MAQLVGKRLPAPAPRDAPRPCVCDRGRQLLVALDGPCRQLAPKADAERMGLHVAAIRLQTEIVPCASDFEVCRSTRADRAQPAGSKRAVVVTVPVTNVPPAVEPQRELRELAPPPAREGLREPHHHRPIRDVIDGLACAIKSTHKCSFQVHGYMMADGGLTTRARTDDKSLVDPNSPPASLVGNLPRRIRTILRELRAELWSSDSALSDAMLAFIAACLALMAVLLVLAAINAGAGVGALAVATVCGCASAAAALVLRHRLRNRPVDFRRRDPSPRLMGEAELIAELEDSEVTLGRSRVLVRRLRRIGTDRCVAVLLDCARSPDTNLSVGAVLALSRVGGDDAVDALIECMCMETGPRLTMTAASLRQTRSRRAIPALVECLETRGDELRPGQKRIVILALGGVPHVSEVPVLAAALRDGRYRIRNAAAWALAQIRAPESTAALETATRELSWLRAIPARRGLRQRRRRADDG